MTPASPFNHRTTMLALAACVFATVACAQSAAPAASKPVLVELFTSEGCSDCPAADALLARLDAQQFLPGVHAIVLSEHVTYWNHLGWIDPFSLVAADSRQQAYASQFDEDSVYTPQMVVDGAAQFVGSSEGELRRAAAKSTATTKQPMTLDGVALKNGNVSFGVHGSFSKEATLTAALAENETRSEVRRGENAGRTLHHVAVVRAIKEFKAGSYDGPIAIALPAKDAPSAGASGSLRLVVFATDRKNGHVIAAAEQTIGR